MQQRNQIDVNEAISFIDKTIDRPYSCEELMDSGYFEERDELYCYYLEIAKDIFAAPEYLYEKIPYLMEIIDDVEYCTNPYRFD